MRVYFNPVMKSETDILIYAKLVLPFVSHPLFLSIWVNLTITKWYESSFNIYCFSNYCVPTSLLSLYRLFPYYESVYILYDILVRVFVNTIFDILHCIWYGMQHIPNISIYYILSIKNKVFCICDTDDYGSVSQLFSDFQPLDPYYSPCRTLLSCLHSCMFTDKI